MSSLESTVNRLRSYEVRAVDLRVGDYFISLERDKAGSEIFKANVGKVFILKYTKYSSGARLGLFLGQLGSIACHDLLADDDILDVFFLETGSICYRFASLEECMDEIKTMDRLDQYECWV